MCFILEKSDTNTPFFVGALFAIYMKQGYMSGGSGYTLSKWVYYIFKLLEIQKNHQNLRFKNIDKSLENELLWLLIVFCKYSKPNVLGWSDFLEEKMDTRQLLLDPNSKT